MYDEIAPLYHLIYRDWDAVIAQQATALDAIIRQHVGPPPRSILDVSCGIGTQALGLAALGHGVTASDLSSGAVARARREAARRNLAIAFTVADMRRCAEVHGSGFDVVLSADNSIPHLLSDDAIREALGHFHRCIRPGGITILGVRDYAPEERMPLVPLVHVHEFSDGGRIMRDENLAVTATLVDHPPVVPAFAYRFDASDRSIVVSGDTLPSDNLIRLAEGADVLVHEALYVPALDRLAARVPNGAALKRSILSHHTPVEEAGRVARAAGVKKLVLSHLVPADDPAVTDQMWLEAGRVHFRGDVILGKDLLEI